MLQEKRPTSYNLEAEQGVDDMVLAKRWGVDPMYAYTPEINKEVMDKVSEHTRKVEYDEAIKQGFSEKDATTYASRIVADGVKRANNNIKTIESLRKKPKKK